MNISIVEIDNLNLSFISADLALVTTLSLFFPITRIDKQNPRKVLFKFSRNKKLEAFIDRYWKKEILVEPRTYFDQLKSLKARIYGNE